MCTPEQWMYTNGSNIKEHVRLGAAYVESHSRAIFYVDAAGYQKTSPVTRV
jgi:hypothetical protein